MNNNAKAAVESVFPQVLEELAFLFADPSDMSSVPGAPHDALKVSMAFSGALSGVLDMAVSQGLGSEIAANLLGVEPEDTQDSKAAHDALRELLNVTCGHVLTTVAGDQAVFDLSIPTVAPIEIAEWKRLASQSDTAFFSVEGRPVMLRVAIPA